MTNAHTSFADLPDDQLLVEVKRLAGAERCATAALVRSLVELDARRLYLGEGCSSLFGYCTRVLHLSEHAAYGRIKAARIAWRFPLVMELFTDGAVNLTTIVLLAPHLTPENYEELLRAATHKSKREVEHLVAAVRPRPDVPSAVRKLPPALDSPWRKRARQALRPQDRRMRESAVVRWCPVCQLSRRTREA